MMSRSQTLLSKFNVRRYPTDNDLEAESRRSRKRSEYKAEEKW
jgi:hypothetical protein